MQQLAEYLTNRIANKSDSEIKEAGTGKREGFLLCQVAVRRKRRRGYAKGGRAAFRVKTMGGEKKIQGYTRGSREYPVRELMSNNTCTMLGEQRKVKIKRGRGRGGSGTVSTRALQVTP